MRESNAGYFAKYLEEEYIKKFSEPPPLDWILTLSGCPNLSVEPSLNSWIVLHVQPLQPVQPPVLGQVSTFCYLFNNEVGREK